MHTLCLSIRMVNTESGFLFLNNELVNHVNFLYLPVRNLSYKVLKYLAENDTSSKWKSQDLKICTLTPESL